MSRTVAAVAVLLAALMHLLACAHGPESRASARSDAVPTVRVAFAQPGAFSPAPACRPSDQDPGHDHEPHCCGGDEPTIQAPRGVARSLPTVQEALPVIVPASGSGQVPPSAQPPAAGTADFSVGPSPARLGVWRT
ncbi:hypothetical protein BEK98_28670 [Streptomyces diastatochromogenes]|uniref:DUF2946 domain-containing protein n=1 Tax=Streptomyces diastatochromogenes TaxID=42236 RepID=A0A233S7Q1_STRDA|nr:hypothetical protein BEK98_28670 [Streptomyces diastatochromogenes]